MMPEPSGGGADLGMSALVPYDLASRPRVSVSCTIMSARHQGSGWRPEPIGSLVRTGETKAPCDRRFSQQKTLKAPARPFAKPVYE